MRNFLVFTAAAAALLASALPAAATVEQPGLADFSEPGSVLVFPKFHNGTVTTPAGIVLPQSLIEIGTVCPENVPFPGCPDHSKLRVHVHLVCPPQTPGGLVCPQTDFIIDMTYGSNSSDKRTFNLAGVPNPPGSDFNGSDVAPIAQCPRGYLIAYAIDGNGRPIRFDGLVGNVVNRTAGTNISVSPALTIQAAGDAPTLSLIDTAGGSLHFDGRPGHYRAVTGEVQGDIAFDSLVRQPFHAGALIFLTLDVLEGMANHPTSVSLEFYNPNEARLSTSYTFVCWGQVSLTSNPVNRLDTNLTAEIFGSFGGNVRHDRGFMVSKQAFDAVNGTPRSLLGLFQYGENDDGLGVPGGARLATYPPFANNSIPVSTSFTPLP